MIPNIIPVYGITNLCHFAFQISLLAVLRSQITSSQNITLVGGKTKYFLSYMQCFTCVKRPEVPLSNKQVLDKAVIYLMGEAHHAMRLSTICLSAMKCVVIRMYTLQ